MFFLENVLYGGTKIISMFSLNPNSHLSDIITIIKVC